MSWEKVVQTAKKTWNVEINILKIQYLHIFSIALNELILCYYIYNSLACGVSSHTCNCQQDVEILTCRI